MIKPMLYFRAFVGQDEIGTDSPDAYDEAIASDYVATHADGSPYTFVTNFSALGAQIDFTDPEAVRRSGETYDGPATETVAAPLERLPWFRRCGTQPF